LLVDTRVAGAPTLLSPQNGYAISDNTPAFEWTIVDATSYNLYVDNNTDFGSPEISKTGLTVNYTLSEGEALGEGNWYWKVVAVRIGGTNSSTTWGIIIDTVAPSPLTLVSPVDGAQTNINHTLLVWNPATDMTSGIANYILQYSQDPNFVSNVTTVPGWTNTSYRIPNALNDGTWCWRVIAVDRAGNAGSYLGYWNFTVDTQPPTGLTLSSVSGIYTNSLVITLSITASGAQQMYLSNNNVTWVEYNFNASTLWTLTAGDDGVRSVYLRCTDAAGNMAYLPGFYIQVTLDTIPPQPGSPSIPAYGFITSNNKTTFQWIAGSDGSGSGIASYSLQLDTTPTFDSENMRSEPVFTGTNHTLTTALNDGTWYWRVNATDRAGNTGSYSAYFSLIISTIPPAQVTGLQPANDSLLNLVSPQFQWNLVTGAYIYHIQIDRDLNFNTPYLIENLTLSDNEFNPSVDNDKTLTDGTWYWRVEAISIAGANSVYSVVRTLMIDVTPPTNPQPVSPPPSGATKVTYHTPFQWSQVQDAISYWIQLDSTLGFNSGDVITSTDIRGTSCILNNTLSYGVWYWRVVALDSAGNIGDFSTAPTPEFTVDTISPSQPTPRSPVQGYLTNQTTPVLAWYAASDPTFNGVSSGVANYTLWLDNSSSLNSINLRTKTGLNTTSYKVASPLSDGTWYWFVNATDRAGNTGQGSITQSFTIDTAAPAPPLISSMYPNGGSLDISKVTFTWNASSDPSGITGYVIQIDVSDKFDTTNRLEYTVGSGTTFTPDKEFPNGQWYWRIAAIDAAGNLGTWSAPVPFVVNVVGGLSPMMIVIVGGGSSGAAILAVLGYVFYRRAKIPFVIKKIDQSIKLITKGEMPQPVPMRSRTEIVQTIFQDKIAILLKEKIEELEAKKGEKAPEKPEEPTEKEAIEAKPKEAEPKKEVEAKPKAAKAVAPSEAEETDVDMIVKELEKLETKEEMEPSKESEFIRREREELEKPKKKKE
nr:Ig-like domain-containing protein [Candidatus Njordarchaeota archaeon]